MVAGADSRAAVSGISQKRRVRTRVPCPHGDDARFVVVAMLLAVAWSGRRRQPAPTRRVPASLAATHRAPARAREYEATRERCRPAGARTARTACAATSSPRACACSTARRREAPSCSRCASRASGAGARSRRVAAGRGVERGRARRDPPARAHRVVRELRGRPRAGLHARRAPAGQRRARDRARDRARARRSSGDERASSRRATGRRLEYAKLVVEDAAGRVLPARIELPSRAALRLVADDAARPIRSSSIRCSRSTTDSLIYESSQTTRSSASAWPAPAT